MILAVIAFISRWISHATLAFAALGLIVMTGIIGWSVFARYVLGDAPAWAEQAALLLMVWFVLLAAAVGVREQFHLGMTAATDAMPEAARKISRMVALLAVAGFGAAMGIWGGELVVRTWAFDIPTLGVPRGAAYLPLPIAGWLSVLFALEHLITEARGRKVEPLWS